MSKQSKKTTPGAHAGTVRFHTYNVGLAIDLNDVVAAIVLNHMHMNIERLEENSKLDSDGIAWLTVSKTGIIRFLCEFSKSQIETAINKLTENGLLVKKVSNRKNSYTLTNLAWSYYPRLPEEGPVKAPKAEANAKVEEKEDNKDVKAIVDYLNEKAGTRYKAGTPATDKHIKARLNEGFTVDDCKAVIDVKTSQWLDNTNMKTYLRPRTLFNEKFQDYLQEARNTKPAVKPAPLKNEDAPVKKLDVYYKMITAGCLDDNVAVNKDHYLKDVRPTLTIKEQEIADSYYD